MTYIETQTLHSYRRYSQRILRLSVFSQLACSWLKLVDGENSFALEELKCNTETTTTDTEAGSGSGSGDSGGAGGAGGAGGGDGCQEYIPGEQNVTDTIKRDVESDFMELFVKLKPETRMKIGHYFDRQNDSLEGQPLQGLIRSCSITGRDCADIRLRKSRCSHMKYTTEYFKLDYGRTFPIRFMETVSPLITEMETHQSSSSSPVLRAHSNWNFFLTRRDTWEMDFRRCRISIV